jgi:prevent-host-death family protein
MSKLPQVVPVTDLRQDATAILKRVKASNKPTLITQRGRVAAVMLSIEAYEHSQNELEILRLLAKGEKDIASGKGHDLDEVLREADAILSQE